MLNYAAEVCCQDSYKLSDESDAYYKFQWTGDTDDKLKVLGSFADLVDKGLSTTKPWKDLKDVMDSIGKVQKSLEHVAAKKQLPAGFGKSPLGYHVQHYVRCAVHSI